MLSKRLNNNSKSLSSANNSCVCTNLEKALKNLLQDEEYIEYIKTYNIASDVINTKLNNYFINRNSKINISKLNNDQKEIVKQIFGSNEQCGKYIFLFSIQHGIGGDESEYFAKDFLEMHIKPLELIFSKGQLLYEKNKRIKLSELHIGKDYYILYDYKEINFTFLLSIFMFLQEGPNIRVQRQPINSTQIQTSTILLNTHLFNFNKTESEIKAFLLQEKYLLWETFRASGAGGQHVNKTSSAVRLRHSILSNVNIVSQQERNQIQNRKNALKKLEEDITQEVINLIKTILTNKESNAGRNVKSTTYNYRRKQVTHEDGRNQTFDSIKKDTYKDISVINIVENY